MEFLHCRTDKNGRPLDELFHDPVTTPYMRHCDGPGIHIRLAFKGYDESRLPKYSTGGHRQGGVADWRNYSHGSRLEALGAILSNVSDHLMFNDEGVALVKEDAQGRHLQQ